MLHTGGCLLHESALHLTMHMPEGGGIWGGVHSVYSVCRCRCVGVCVGVILLEDCVCWAFM